MFGAIRSKPSRNKYCEYSRYPKYFLSEISSILPGTGSICESIHSQIDGPSRGRSSKLLSRGATGVLKSILAASSSIYFGSILRVLAAFPGSIYSGYSGYCRVSTSNVCTAGAAVLLYSGFCILLITFPALPVFGPSVLVILLVLAVLI